MSSRATLASVAEELDEQPSLLSSFRNSSLWSELGERGDPIFVGAGDSYAACLCASFLAGPRVLALDPYSLAESLGWARGRPVYIVSISGETKTNVDLARSLKGVAKTTVAVTCNPKSRLAAVVDRLVELPFRPRAKSPGVASFTLSLAAALKVCGLDSEFEFESALAEAKSGSKRVRIAPDGNVTHFVGNNEAYAVSVYGAAKVYELLGRRAQASLLEEFSHMPLFSLRALDRVNVLETHGSDKGKRLDDALRRGGFASSLTRNEGNRLEGVYFLTFVVQVAAVDAATRAGLKEPRFLQDRKKLKISDSMIY